MTRVLACACAVAALVGASPALAGASVSVEVDRTQVSTALGRDFSFATRIVNKGSAPTQPLVAHLNVLNLRPGVYVDPEDWSSRRTVFVDALAPGGSRRIAWNVKAVNSGQIGIYVTVLPRSGTGRPVASPTVRVSIAERRTLNSGGILPLALGIPGLLALLTLSVRFSRRRS